MGISIIGSPDLCGVRGVRFRASALRSRISSFLLLAPRLMVFGVLISLSLGFRTFSSQKTFTVNNTSPEKTKIFIDFDQATTTLENDLPSGDPLQSTNPITVSAAMTSIFNDFNSIAAAYVQLVATSDSDYATESPNRIITIRRSAPSGLSGGEAQLQFNGNQVVGCNIIIKEDAYQKANRFISVVTHEIGHCLGLDHPQETVNSVMSYFNGDVARLQIDDKMGITFLYPVDPSKTKENITLGMACTKASSSN